MPTTFEYNSRLFCQSGTRCRRVKNGEKKHTEFQPNYRQLEYSRYDKAVIRAVINFDRKYYFILTTAEISGINIVV